MQINSPEEFIRAINQALLHMNKEQRVAFVRWVKRQTVQYNFNYPQGYKEPTNAEQPVNNPTVPSDSANQPNVIEGTLVESNESSAPADSGS